MALYEFKRQNNILSVSLEDSRNILSNEIQKLSEAANEAKTKRIQIAARHKVLSTLRTGDPLTDPAIHLKDNDVISKPRETYADQSSKLLELKGKYLEQHPLVLAQEARLDALRSELRREAGLALKAEEAQYALAVETEKSLLAALEQAKQEALALNRKQIEFERLKRNADNNAKLYDLVLGRLKESDLASHLPNNNVRWLDHRSVPTSPVSPNVPGTLGLALLLGLLFGTGLAFLLDYLDNTVKSQDDIESTLGLPFLGLIPTISGDAAPAAKPLHIVEHSKSMVAECC